jgi:hypothetical protein
MKLRFMWKESGDCSDGDCPSLYETEGGYVVQGVVLDDETRAQLRNLGDDEDALFVPAALLDRLRKEA